jgi:hypothetical protein
MDSEPYLSSRWQQRNKLLVPKTDALQSPSSEGPCLLVTIEVQPVHFSGDQVLIRLLHASPDFFGAVRDAMCVA